MLVRCPRCGTEFRLVDYQPDERVVRYLCPGCEQIVRLDLEKDEVRSSSSAGSYQEIRRRSTVLVADDSDRILKEAEEILREAGYQVLLAGDGAEALEHIREEHPDLVVVDLLMPGMTGFDILREIRKDPRIADTPVLAMSGVYRENVLAFLHELGAQGFMEKRNLRDNLVFRVRSLLKTDEA